MSPQSSNSNKDFDPSQNENDLVREQLVAYLDGELSDELSQAVERQISEDDAVREEIQSLDQAWNALDALPLESTNHDFTKSTIAMVTMAAKDDVIKATTAMPVMRKKRRWGTAVTLTCFACAGFLLSSLIVSYQDRQLIRNLPAIRYAKTLNQVGDMEFLKAWSDEASESIPASRLTSLTEEAETWGMLTSASFPDRFRWTEALPPEDMSQLADQATAFNAQAKVKQDRLIELNHQLGETEDAENLRRYALLYEQLVSKLPPIEQASLRNMPTDQRINRMRKEVRRQRDRLLLEMTDAEQKTFRSAIDNVLQRIDSMDSDLVDNMIRKRYSHRYPGKTMTKEQILLIKMRGMAWMASRPRPKNDQRAFSFSKANAEIWDSLRADLVEALPSRIQEQVMEEKGNPKQTDTILRLIGSTLQSTSITDASAYFAEELNQKQQLEYLSLSKEEMQERLEDRLSSEMFEVLDDREGPWSNRRGRGGPPPGPGGEDRPPGREPPPGFRSGPRGDQFGPDVRGRPGDPLGPRRGPRPGPPQE